MKFARRTTPIATLSSTGKSPRTRAAAALLTAAASLGGLTLADPAVAADPIQITITTPGPLQPFSPGLDDNGFGGSYPGILAGGVITCPPGTPTADNPGGLYQQVVTLTQDGYQESAPFEGNGSYEWSCTGAPQEIGDQFYNTAHLLHPGPATVTITLSSYSGTVLASSTQTVTIPESIPSAPTAATAGMTSTSSATLTWTPPVVAGGTITGYRVSRDGGAVGAAGWSTTVAATTRSLTFANLVLGRTYTLSVAAINSHGASPTATAKVIPGTPGLPTKVAAPTATVSTATLTWGTPVTAGSSAITGYRVSRDGGAYGGTTWTGVVSASTRSFTFAKLSGSNLYHFTVAAINAKGTGGSQMVQRFIPGATP